MQGIPLAPRPHLVSAISASVRAGASLADVFLGHKTAALLMHGVLASLVAEFVMADRVARYQTHCGRQTALHILESRFTPQRQFSANWMGCAMTATPPPPALHPLFSNISNASRSVHSAVPSATELSSLDREKETPIGMHFTQSRVIFLFAFGVPSVSNMQNHSPSFSSVSASAITAGGMIGWACMYRSYVVKPHTLIHNNPGGAKG